MVKDGRGRCGDGVRGLELVDVGSIDEEYIYNWLGDRTFYPFIPLYAEQEGISGKRYDHWMLGFPVRDIAESFLH